MIRLFKKVLINSFLVTFSFPISAADVPAGTKLAEKQIFNKGNGAEIATIDPQKTDDVQSANVSTDLFEGLVRESAHGKMIPAGATNWTVSANGLVWTFHLRDNAKWSNGDKVTAQDYVYGMQRLVDPKIASTYSFLLLPVKNAEAITAGKMPTNSLGVAALDDHTLQITLNSPVPYLLEILSLQNCAPAPKKAMEKAGSKYFQAGTLLSNGPYKLKYWGVGDKVTLVKNPFYWNASKTVITEVNYYPTQNVNSEEQMFLSGQLDYTYDISIDQFKSLKKKLGSQVHSNPYIASYWLDFNMQKEPFKSNPKLREALSMVVDRDVITKTITGRGETSGYDIVPTGTKHYTPFKPAWSQLPYSKRVAQAKKLYNEAGYSADKPLTVTILYSTNENYKKIILAVASMLKSTLGVQVRLENQEWKVFIVTRQAHNYEIAWDRWIADYNDVNTFSDLLRSDNILNSPGYANPKYDELLQKAAVEQNPQKRMQLLQNAGTVAMNDNPIIPLYYAVSTHLVRNNIGGYTGMNPLDHVSTFDLYIKR